MLSRRVACFLVGLWLGGGVLVAWLTADSFRAVDRTLAQLTPDAAARLRNLPAGDARLLFRYEVSERNRAMFEMWEIAQLFSGAGMFFYFLFGTREGKLPMVLVLAMLAIVVFQRFMFTPLLVALGRVIDFVPDPNYQPRREFWVVHGAYSVAEVAKWLIGLGLTVMLAVGRGRGRSGDAGENLDSIDKRNHRHVNR